MESRLKKTIEQRGLYCVCLIPNCGYENFLYLMRRHVLCTHLSPTEKSDTSNGDVCSIHHDGNFKQCPNFGYATTYLHVFSLLGFIPINIFAIDILDTATDVIFVRDVGVERSRCRNIFYKPHPATLSLTPEMFVPQKEVSLEV